MCGLVYLTLTDVKLCSLKVCPLNIRLFGGQTLKASKYVNLCVRTNLSRSIVQSRTWTTILICSMFSNSYKVSIFLQNKTASIFDCHCKGWSNNSNKSLRVEMESDTTFLLLYIWSTTWGVCASKWSFLKLWFCCEIFRKWLYKIRLNTIGIKLLEYTKVVQKNIAI